MRLTKADVPEGIIPGEPTWDVARLFPTQGNWSESEYLALETNQLVEFSHGFVEFLPMPTLTHQRIAQVSFQRTGVHSSLGSVLGEVLLHGGQGSPLARQVSRARRPVHERGTRGSNHRRNTGKAPTW